MGVICVSGPEIESIRTKLARAADREHVNEQTCVRVAFSSGRARCGAGAGCSAINYQSLPVLGIDDTRVSSTIDFGYR